MDTAAGGDALADADVQSKILQNTLNEVAARQPDSTHDDKPSEDCHRPTTTTTTTTTSSTPTRCCVICLDAITEPCEAHPCRHGDFDYLCLLSWLEQQNKCPLCKSDIHEVRHVVQGETKAYLVPPPKKQYRTATAPLAEQQQAHQEYLRYRINNRARREDRRPYPSSAERQAAATRNEALARRQHVYRNQLYSLHVGANRTSRYRRELTPDLFDTDPELVSRARQFLRRELDVFEFLRPSPSSSPSTSAAAPASSSSTSAIDGHVPRRHNADRILTRRRANNAEFLLEYIIAILKTVDTQGSSGQAVSMLADFLGRDHASLLLHELRNFLRSPYSLESWDRHVQYPLPPPVDSASSYPSSRSSRRRGDASTDRIPRGFQRRRRPSIGTGRTRSRSPTPRHGRGGGGGGGDSYRPDYSDRRRSDRRGT